MEASIFIDADTFGDLVRCGLIAASLTAFGFICIAIKSMAD